MQEFFRDDDSFEDTDEQQQGNATITGETLLIGSKRPVPGILIFADKNPSNPTRDALMLEAYLTTTLQPETLVYLIHYLNLRYSTNQNLQEFFQRQFVKDHQTPVQATTQHLEATEPKVKKKRKRKTQDLEEDHDDI